MAEATVEKVSVRINVMQTIASMIILIFKLNGMQQRVLFNSFLFNRSLQTRRCKLLEVNFSAFVEPSGLRPDLSMRHK